jgi:hypothetical protein
VEKNKKKYTAKKETKRGKKQEDSIEGALCVFSLLLCGGAL